MNSDMLFFSGVGLILNWFELNCSLVFWWTTTNFFQVCGSKSDLIDSELQTDLQKFSVHTQNFFKVLNYTKLFFGEEKKLCRMKNEK